MDYQEKWSFLGKTVLVNDFVIPRNGHFHQRECMCVSVRWNWCFMMSKQLSYVMANSSVNRCPMQRKNSLPEMRFAPWTANSHCISDRCWPCIALSMGAWQKTKLKVDENKNHDRIPWSQLIKIVSNYFRSECLST